MGLDAKDGGYRSRKFWLAIGAMLLMAATVLVGIFTESAVLAGLLPALVGGIVAVYTAFVGGNVSAKYVYSKQSAPPPVKEEKEEGEKEVVGDEEGEA